MSHTHPFGIVFWIALFLEYSTKEISKNFRNDDNFFYSILIRLALRICEKYVI